MNGIGVMVWDNVNYYNPNGESFDLISGNSDIVYIIETSGIIRNGTVYTSNFRGVAFNFNIEYNTQVIL